MTDSLEKQQESEQAPLISAGAPETRAEDRERNALERELEWLLDIHQSLRDVGPWTRPAARRRRLPHLLAAATKHLDCALGALIVPERNLRIVHGALETQEPQPERLLEQLAPPVLHRLNRKDGPLMFNRARVGGSPRLRLLAVPLAISGNRSAGALLLVRSIAAPPLTGAHLALARHLGGLIAASLESELDPATGLHTRASLKEQLESTSLLERASSSPHAIVSIRIDRLDAINKTSGFDAGDAAIAGVAGLLRALHGPSDALAGRISSNEFALVLPCTDAERARGTAETLQRLSATLLAGVADGEEPISLSCGIAPIGSASEFESGLALAQLACRTARKRGAGRIELYHDTDASMIQRHTDIVAVQRLRDAMRENRLTLFAQRIAPLREAAENGGYELLLRSLDELGDNRAPQQLLSAAHRNHLAPAVDLWVIEHALAEAAPYRMRLKEADVSLCINISGPSLTDASFLKRVRWLIEQSRVGPSRITFEITETVAILSLARAVAFIKELRALGCRFALDDFGTGANSLKNLTSLPVDRVKIDGSFVADLLTSRQSESMVRAIVSLARDLGIGTVAEYAEGPEIIERLRELGVQYAQGYGIERPRPFPDILREVRRAQAERHILLASG